MARVRVAMRGAVLAPGEARLTEGVCRAGLPAKQALDAAVERISAVYHPPVHSEVLSGWCSWYYFYEKVTENDAPRRICVSSWNTGTAFLAGCAD